MKNVPKLNHLKEKTMPNTSNPSDVSRYTVIAQGLNVRATPSLQGKVLEILDKDTVVERIDTSGDRYWFMIRHNETTGWASRKYLQPVVEEIPASDFPWFEIAFGEIGVREVSGSGDNPRIVQYHRSTTLEAPSASNDETPWCSSFVNWCVERSGNAGTDSAWARSWLHWGRLIENPVKGCIVVFERGSGSGHVGFFISQTATHIQVLGGNQNDAVNISNYEIKRLLGYRIPN